MERFSLFLDALVGLNGVSNHAFQFLHVRTSDERAEVEAKLEEKARKLGFTATFVYPTSESLGDPGDLVGDWVSIREVRSERGTKVAATMYSLVETAKINRVDPALYLKLAALEAVGGRPIPLPHHLG